MILVTGSTGHLGKATIDSLLKKIPPHEIAALARDFQKAEDIIAKGVEVIKGDYNNYQSLVRAFVGIKTLLLVSSNDMENRTNQHINAINAAKEAGVKHIMFTSFQRKNDGPTPISFLTRNYIDTEEYLIASGITYTIFRNALYTDTIPMFIGEDVLRNGVIFFPAGKGKVSFTTRNDMAEALANVLTSKEHENKTYEIAAGESYSFGDVAEILSELSGDQIGYVDPPVEVFKQELAKAEVPAMYIDMFAGFGEAIAQDHLNLPDNTLERLLGRKPTGLREYLKETYADQLTLKKQTV